MFVISFTFCYAAMLVFFSDLVLPMVWGWLQVLSMYALLTQAGWDHRLQWRPLCYIPKYLRINIALVVSLLTVYSNLAAIVGLLKVSVAVCVCGCMCLS